MTATLPSDVEHTMLDHYTIELRHGTDPEALEVERTQTARSGTDAISIIEAFRDRCSFRYNVTWRSDEVDQGGDLYGLAPGGEIWQINVTPDLDTELAS